uniref:Uncharacterized protein n=1 Tax=Ananas comosus var. bracteatus TaxID=296719 RepID=A0A6V7NIX8_ANACO|nr:unnamed protein product [Ananas comosus var. bracteatus]
MDYFICPSHPLLQSPSPGPCGDHQDDDGDGDGDGDGDAGGDGPPCKEFIKDIPVVVYRSKIRSPRSSSSSEDRTGRRIRRHEDGLPMAGAKLIVPHVEPDPILFDEEGALQFYGGGRRG